MDFLTRFSDNLYETFIDVDLKHAIRLVIIIGGYWLFRQAAQRFLARRQLDQQVKADRDDKAQEKIDSLVDEEVESWGWGKKTRKQVKRREKIVQEALENMHSYTPDDDKDIADLLED